MKATQHPGSHYGRKKAASSTLVLKIILLCYKFPLKPSSKLDSLAATMLSACAASARELYLIKPMNLWLVQAAATPVL